MAGKRDKPEEIVLKLRQVKVLQGQGMTISEAVRQIGMTIQTTIAGASSEPCPPLVRGQWRARNEPRSTQTPEGAGD